MDTPQILGYGQGDSNGLGMAIMDRTLRAPAMGVLTRTLIRSPVVKWIIPARIRHKDKNDILFIHHNWIEIMELSSDGHLCDVAIKADFDSAIRSARVLGATRKPALVKEPEEEGIDAIIKQEAPELMVSAPDNMHEVAPQILVMALESNNLVFVFATQHNSEPVRFISYQHPLAAESERNKTEHFKLLGRHIAVDPKSRALAVAAYGGRFVLYALKPIAQLKAEVELNGTLIDENFRPLKAEKRFAMDGIILRMEFLHPFPGDDSHVILLLVVSRGGRTRLMWYEWDSSKDLDTTKWNGSGYPVNRDEQLPLLLIPFTTSPGFLLVCEKVMSSYRNILTGQVVSTVARLKPIKELEQPEELGSSKRFPLWTYWARPVRRDGWDSTNEVIYLCREDGVVRFLEFQTDSDINLLANVGRLETNIDSAFASLDIGNGYYDLLAAAGDMSDGGLFTFKARKNVAKIQCIPSWTPVIDFVAVPSSSSSISALSPNKIRNRGNESIYACVGRGKRHGAICEIRFGIEAQSSVRIPIGDYLQAGILGMWILPDVSGHGIFILLTNPSRSFVFFVPTEGDDIQELLDDETGISLDSQTLSAGSTKDGLIVQITQNSILGFVLHNERIFEKGSAGCVIIAACIEGAISAILTAIRRGGDVYLQGGIFRNQGNEVFLEEFGNPITLSSDPSSLSLHAIGQHIYAFVGTLEGTLQIYQVFHGQFLSPLCEHKFDGDFSICDSIAIIFKHHTENPPDDILVLCGLRNGFLQIFKMLDDQAPDGPTFLHCETVLMGSTSVTVTRDTSTATQTGSCCSKALVVCRDALCRLEYSHNQSGQSQAAVTSIWLTDHEEPGFSQGPILAAAQSDPWNCNRMTDSPMNLLFCIESSQLHMAQLSACSQSRAVPRPLSIGGTPTRILYSTQLATLVVALTKTNVRTNKRLVQSYLSLIHKGHFLHKDDRSAFDSELYKVGRPGERVMALLEWFPSDVGNNSYHLLVVTTLLPHKSHKNTGHLYIYRVARDDGGKYSLKLIFTIKLDDAVCAVAAHGSSSLVYSSGSQLILHTLQLSNKKFEPSVASPLASPAIHISVEGPYVYVSTLRSSLSIFKVEKNRLVPQMSDSEAGSGLYHLALPPRSLILASNRERRLLGLWQPPVGQMNNSTSTLFQAVLPGSLTRLRRGSFKPPWHHGPTPARNTILGSSADGSFYQLELLSEASWRLLCFIQNLARRNSVVCPSTYQSQQNKHIEPSNQKEHYLHVDGDILLRILDRGTPDDTSLLRTMLVEEPEQTLSGRRLHDFDTAQARYGRFCELVAAALAQGTEDDPVQAVVKYLRCLLQPVL